MRDKSLLPRYTPAVPPTDAEALPLYIQAQLTSIASMLNTSVRNFPPLNASPDKPMDGDVAFADGSSWDPGEGRGLYYFDSAWIKL